MNHFKFAVFYLLFAIPSLASSKAPEEFTGPALTQDADYRQFLSIDAMNAVLADIEIDRGYLHLSEIDAPYPYVGARAILLWHSKIEPPIGAVIHELVNTRVGPANHIASLGVSPWYQQRGLGYILTLMALNRRVDQAKISTVQTVSDGSEKIFAAIGFDYPEHGAVNLYTMDVEALLQQNAWRLVNQALKKLHDTKGNYCAHCWRVMSK